MVGIPEIIDFYLVGGIPTPVKNMKVNWGYYSQLNGKIIQMFQTTNQFMLVAQNHSRDITKMSGADARLPIYDSYWYLMGSIQILVPAWKPAGMKRTDHVGLFKSPVTGMA